MKTAKKFFGCLMMVMVAVSQGLPSPVFAEEKTIPTFNVTVEGEGSVKITENNVEHRATPESPLSLRLQENVDVLFDIQSTHDIVMLTNNGEIMAEFVEGKKEMQFTYTVQPNDQTIHVVFEGETTSGLSPPEKTDEEDLNESSEDDSNNETYGIIDVDTLKEYNQSIEDTSISKPKRSTRNHGGTFNDITGANVDGEQLASKARGWVGRLRYVNGSKHPNSGSIDCSGFVTWMFREYLGTMWIGGTQGGWSYNPEHFVGDRSSYYTANSGPGMYTMGAWDSYTGHLYLDQYGIGSPNLMDVRAWDTLLRNGKAGTSLSRSVASSSLTMCGRTPNEGFESFNPGDIVIFYLDTAGNDTGASSGLDPHMGIYSGNGNFIHSSMATGGVAESPITSIHQGSSAATVKSYRIFRVSESKGSLSLNKKSSNPSITDNNPNYSVKGAEYGLYRNETDANKDTNRIGTFTVKEDGTTNRIDSIKSGTYYLKETKAPKGYALDLKVHSVEVLSGQLVTKSLTDIPQSDPVVIMLRKRDKETGQNVPQRDAKLEGAEFTVKYYKGEYAEGVDPATQGARAERTWVLKTDEDGFTALDKSLLVSGDEFYYASNGDPTIPVGTVTMQETKAPEGYLLNNEIFVVKVKPKGNNEILNTYQEPIVPEQVIKGKIRIAKKDKDTGKVIQVAGTVFDIYFNGQKVSSMTTDKTGYATSEDLAYGEYVIKEAKAPNGYAIDVNQEAVVDIKAKQTYDTELHDKRVNATINLVKEDKDTGDRPQGEATLEGAVYGLYAKEDILDPSMDGTVLHKKDSLIGQITTDKNASGTIENLYLGEYYWQEIRPSEGYELDKTKYPFTASYKDQNTITVTVDSTVKETIRTGEFDIIKTITDGSQSEIMTNEKGAEFVAVLLMDYEANGKDIQKALQYAKENRSEKEYMVLTTNENGYAKSGPLAYGQYVIQQTKRGENAEETDILEGTFTFEVAEVDGQTIVKGADTNGNTLQVGEDGKMHYHINNRPSTYSVRLMKQDLDTGRIVTFDSAKFKIKDSKGNYVTQTVGGRVYDTFVTNSENGQIGIFTRLFGSEWQSNDDEKGSVVVPLQLQAGVYTLEEVEAPNGFLALEEPIEFVIERKQVTESTPSGDPLFTIVAKNDQPTGTLKVNKTVESFDADTSFIHRNDLRGIEFSLYAKKDIIDMIDGSILYKKGERFGTYSLSMDGKLTVTNIPMGSYVLKETKVPNGFVLDTQSYDVVFTQNDLTTKEYVVTHTIENKTTKHSFSKVDITGEHEVVGAKMQVKDHEGTIVDTWVSSKTPHVIEGLTVGETYTLVEESAPNGFVKANSIEFTVPNTEEIQTISMVDTIERVAKVDEQGNYVENAKLQVLSSKSKNIIDQWISNAQIVELTEEQSKQLESDGNLEFTNDGVEYTIQANIGSNDYTLQIVESDGFVSYYDIDSQGRETTHRISGLDVGQDYILREVQAPKDYARAVDQEFKVENEPKDGLITMVNKQVSFTKEDFDGHEISGAAMKVVNEENKVVDEWISGEKKHIIQNLEVGKTYTLIEESAPNGYVLANAAKFTVIDDGLNQHETMVDTIERVAKVDEKGNYVKGATLQVVSNKSKQIVDQWVSGAQIVELTEEQSKALETNGNLEFENDGVEYTIQANTGSNDYTLQIVESDGFVSYYDIDSQGRETTHRVSNLEQGHSYVVREVETPKGYRHADDMILEEVGSADHCIKMVDERIKTTVRIHKVDSETGEAIPSGDFEFTIFSDADCQKKILTVKGEKEVGIATIKQIPVGVWYIRETKAPVGYQLSDEIVKYEVKDTGKVYVNDKEISKDAGEQWTYSIVYKNKKAPKKNTGVAIHDTFKNMMLSILVVSFGVFVWILRKMKFER